MPVARRCRQGADQDPAIPSQSLLTVAAPADARPKLTQWHYGEQHLTTWYSGDVHASGLISTCIDATPNHQKKNIGQQTQTKAWGFQRANRTQRNKRNIKITINTYPPVSRVHQTWRASGKEGKDHAHLVFNGGLLFPGGLVRNLDIQITVVFGIRSTSQPTPNLLIFRNSNRLRSVKHSLPSPRSGPCLKPNNLEEDVLPVGVVRVRTGRELHGLVRAPKRDIKPHQEGMNV